MTRTSALIALIASFSFAPSRTRAQEAEARAPAANPTAETRAPAANPTAETRAPAANPTAETRAPAANPTAEEREPESAAGETIVIVPPPPSPEDSGTSTHADADRALRDSAFVTTVRTIDRSGEQASVAEVLARAAGVSVRSMGGLGGFSSLSVRGSDSGHTAVLVDGVPLSRISTTVADLSQLDLYAFDEIELYRGVVPVDLGSAGLGGALQLHTALGPVAGRALTLSTGLGSFGARHLRMRWLGGDDDTGVHLSAGYAGARGDYSFFDDGGTPLNPADDRKSIRQNNHFDRVEGVFRVGDVGERWTSRFGTRTSYSQQGLPGAAHDQAQDASLSTLRQILDASFERPFGRADRHGIRARGFVSAERQRFADPQDEIGLLAQDVVYWTLHAGAASSVRMRLARGHRLDVGAEAGTDAMRETPQGMDARSGSTGHRETVALALAHTLDPRPNRWIVQPAVRVDALRTSPGRDTFESADMRPARTDWFASPRIAGRFSATSSSSIKASLGRYARVATLLEMFGDRGYVLGNPDLRNESGEAVDCGLVYAPSQSFGILDRIFVEVVGYAKRPHDPIVFVSRNSLVAQAINLEGARILGTEAAASVRLARRLTMAASHSFTYARVVSSGSTNGLKLPQRPEHQLYGRADLALDDLGRGLAVWADALASSGNVLDELNLVELPPRLLLAAGIKLGLVYDLRLSLVIKNLLGARTESIALSPAPSPELQSIPRALADVHGYPLPGRAFYWTLEWSH